MEDNQILNNGITMWTQQSEEQSEEQSKEQSKEQLEPIYSNFTLRDINSKLLLDDLVAGANILQESKENRRNKIKQYIDEQYYDRLEKLSLQSLLNVEVYIDNTNDKRKTNLQELLFADPDYFPWPPGFIDDLIYPSLDNITTSRLHESNKKLKKALDDHSEIFHDYFDFYSSTAQYIHYMTDLETIRNFLLKNKLFFDYFVFETETIAELFPSHSKYDTFVAVAFAMRRRTRRPHVPPTA